VKRALVVAHPDDETLWFGGLVIAEPGRWHVFCASTPRTDPVRAQKFLAACDILGADCSEISGIVESDPSGALDWLPYRLPDLTDYDQIVTHNAVGEYGHRHHVSIHDYLVARYPSQVVTGCYGMQAGERRIELTVEQYDRKVQALRCYDHVSPSDGKPKWQALIERYGGQFDLTVETYAW
jgi:LmbE family N-acetylglucosaminyl deacetylase